MCVVAFLLTLATVARGQNGGGDTTPPDGDPGAATEAKPRGPTSLAEAVRNLQQYVNDPSRNGAQSGAGPEVQFNAKGVEFGPWLRPFIAQVERNWFIPVAAEQVRDSAVVRFKVRRDGTIADIETVRPAATAALELAAVNALRRSSPVNPLPPAYPDASLPMTITFNYGPTEREFVFTGPAEFYPRVGSTTFQLWTTEQIKQEGLRFFVLGTETYNGKTYTKVRVQSPSVPERIGWIDKVPRTNPSPTLPGGVVGGVVGALPVAPPPPPPAAAGSSPVRIGGNIPPPRKTKHVNPVYPDIAQSSRTQGVVILEATIGPDGKVGDARVIRSIPLLDQAAVDAVRQWEFSPTSLNGIPVSVIMTVTVQFTLN